MTTNLRLLSVQFDATIAPWELAAFRGAVARKAGLEHDLFHNHNNDTGGYHQRYPLIQYKIDTHKGQMRPMLLCVDEGIEEVHHFFAQPDWTLQLASKSMPLRIHRINVLEHSLCLLEQPQVYRLHKWRPFNEDNHDHWRSLSGLAEQFAYLERLLTAHILAFAGGVGWHVPHHLLVKIIDLRKREYISYKGVRQEVFTLDFESNVSLPDYIGLGKGVALGMGVVRRQGWGKEKEKG